MVTSVPAVREGDSAAGEKRFKEAGRHGGRKSERKRGMRRSRSELEAQVSVTYRYGGRGGRALGGDAVLLSRGAQRFLRPRGGLSLALGDYGLQLLQLLVLHPQLILHLQLLGIHTPLLKGTTHTHTHTHKHKQQGQTQRNTSTKSTHSFLNTVDNTITLNTHDYSTMRPGITDPLMSGGDCC